MDAAEQVESYSSAAAARHLDAIDNTFVAHLLRLLPQETAAETQQHREIPVQKTNDWDLEVQGTRARSNSAWGLDVGTGPGQIPIKILTWRPGLKMIGLDRSPTMLACARRNAEQAGVSGRLALLVGDGHSLPFPDRAFALVICNSVLHHARAPVEMLREIFRVADGSAPVLIRDLRRPSRPFLQWHLWRHGRHYDGWMRRLFDDSVRAAYTLDELEGFLGQAQFPAARVFRFRGAHIGVAREAGNRE